MKKIAALLVFGLLAMAPAASAHHGDCDHHHGGHCDKCKRTRTGKSGNSGKQEGPGKEAPKGPNANP